MSIENDNGTSGGHESSRVLRIQMQPVVFRRAVVPLARGAAFLVDSMAAVHEALASLGAPLKGGPYTRTLRITAQGMADLEAGFPVETPVTDLRGFRSGYLPGGTAIQRLHVGPVQDVSKTQRLMLTELMATFRFVQDGPGWVYHLTNPATTAPEDSMAMVVMPIRERHADAKKLKALLDALPNSAPLRVT